MPDPKADYDMRDFPDTLASRCQIEAREPLCTGHKVPREGVVVRIEGEPSQCVFIDYGTVKF